LVWIERVERSHLYRGDDSSEEPSEERSEEPSEDNACVIRMCYFFRDPGRTNRNRAYGCCRLGPRKMDRSTMMRCRSKTATFRSIRLRPGRRLAAAVE
jgi:hypothetical protein